jgi:hypothetical protein
MVTSILRHLRGTHYTHSTKNRYSTASTLTQNSTKTDTHPSHHSGLGAVTKRAFSLFDSRSSWAGTPSAPAVEELDENTPLMSSATATTYATSAMGVVKVESSPVSEGKSGSVNGSHEGEKRFRKITPKIRALKEKFEFWGSDQTSVSSTHDEKYDNKENRESYVKEETPSPIKAVTIIVDPAQPVINQAVREEEEKSSVTDLPSPLKSRSHNILRGVPSFADLGRRNKKREGKTRPVSDTSSKVLDAKTGRSWAEKVERLAEWADSLGVGPMPETLNVPSDRLNQAYEPVANGFALLTPEEDLAECVGETSCHPWRVGYFAKVLREVRRLCSGREWTTE